MLINSKVDIFNKLVKLKSYGYKYINKIDSIEKEKTKLPNNLKKLLDVIDNCNLCKLSNLCKEKTPFTGNINNKVLFVSTQSIHNDKYYKDFFVLISKILNIKIEDINILNVLKCDVSNIKNIDIELTVCKDYIIKELDIIRPLLVISLGDAYKFLNNKYEHFEKGNINKLKSYDLLIVEHPYYIQQNPSLKDDFIEHINKIKRYLEIN